MGRRGWPGTRTRDQEPRAGGLGGTSWGLSPDGGLCSETEHGRQLRLSLRYVAQRGCRQGDQGQRAWAGPDDCGVTTLTVWPSAIESGGLTTTCSSPERPLATSSSVPRSRWMFTFCRRTLLSRSTVATCAPSLRNR